MKKIFFPLFIISCLLSFALLWGQTEQSGRNAPYRATHNKTTELLHTKLKVNFDFEKEEMHGEEWLTAAPYFYPSDSLV